LLWRHWTFRHTDPGQTLRGTLGAHERLHHLVFLDPRNLDELEAAREYPKGLKIFTYYILLPIVFVYLAILYAYLAKILISWDWPQGWVSKLILGFAGTGTFSLLLLHPLNHQTENIWVRSLIRWFMS
jgi:hypothetical protein